MVPTLTLSRVKSCSPPGTGADRTRSQKEMYTLLSGRQGEEGELSECIC